LNNFAKIYRVNKFVKAYGYWDYLINFFEENEYHDNISGMYIDESDIKRKMTNEEIAEFETKIALTKYNL
jgi:hypothetical protein